MGLLSNATAIVVWPARVELNIVVAVLPLVKLMGVISPSVALNDIRVLFSTVFPNSSNATAVMVAFVPASIVAGAFSTAVAGSAALNNILALAITVPFTLVVTVTLPVPLYDSVAVALPALERTTGVIAP